MRAYGRLWGCSRCLPDSGLLVPVHRVLPLATSPLTTHRPTMPKFTGEETHGAAGGAHVLLMEMHLPLLFAACRNCAEPQRQEPERGSASSCLPPPPQGLVQPSRSNPAPGGFCCSSFAKLTLHRKRKSREDEVSKCGHPAPEALPTAPQAPVAWKQALVSYELVSHHLVRRSPFGTELCQRSSMVAAAGKSLHWCLSSVW